MSRPEFDHLVLVAADVDRTLAFYCRVLGAEVLDHEAWRASRAKYPVLHFGSWKLNVHARDTAATPVARDPRPGTLDLCLRWPTSADAAIAHLRACGVEVELGPVPRTGALGPGESVYFRDPDGNLLELLCAPAVV